MSYARAFAVRFGSSLLSASIALMLAAPASALPYTNLIVFGDRIVDQGNTQAAAIGNGFPDPAPAAAGYLGGRFTNGINPADVLNQEIEGSHSVGSLFGDDNFAFGGTRARDIMTGNLSGAARQAVIEAAVAAVSTAIGNLQSPGAQNILFAGVGDVGGIPEAGLLGVTSVDRPRST